MKGRERVKVYAREMLARDANREQWGSPQETILYHKPTFIIMLKAGARDGRTPHSANCKVHDVESNWYIALRQNL